MSKTKSDLIELIGEHEIEISVLKEKLKTSEAETRRFQNDAIREEKNFRDCEEKLSAIRQVVMSSLRVKHTVGVVSQDEYFNGRVVAEDSSEDIRLLRYIYELSNTQPPF